MKVFNFSSIALFSSFVFLTALPFYDSSAVENNKGTFIVITRDTAGNNLNISFTLNGKKKRTGKNGRITLEVIAKNKYKIKFGTVKGYNIRSPKKGWKIEKVQTGKKKIIRGVYEAVGSSADKSFVRRSDSRLVAGNNNGTIYLRGVNLAYDRVSDEYCGGGAWRMADHTDNGIPVTCWYQKKHFKLIKNIGFNVARLNLSYRIFEDNADPGNWKQSGWDLIDKLIQWGKEYGVYLILDMHVAPGGAGIVSCMGCGWRTWDEQPYLQRFKALWRAIAERYAEETQIAAYDLLNEPAPTQSATQWKRLAQSLINEIRQVDPNHLVIVEMPNWIFDKNDLSPLENFDSSTLKSFQFLLNDNNVLYDFHYYLPTSYTLQDETGVNGGKYP